MDNDILTIPPDLAPPDDYRKSFVPVESVEEKPVDWLIQGYIPKSAIVVLASEGGVGKTLTWCHILAKRTQGKHTVFETDLFPEYIAPAGNVVFFTGEDSVSRVLKKRLREAGADMSRAFTVPPSDPMFSSIDLMSPAIEWACKELSPQIIVFDPLQAFITAKTDMASRSDMRHQFKALTALAEKYETTFLVICHTNKRKNAYGRDRIADSADVWDVARSVIMAGKVGDEIHFTHEKSSYGQLEKTILCEISGNAIQFVGTSDKRDADYMADRPTVSSKSGSLALAEAQEFIVDYLREAGIATGSELMEACKTDGFSQHTIERARSGLNKRNIIRKESKPLMEGKRGRQWFWELNPDVKIPWE